MQPITGERMANAMRLPAATLLVCATLIPLAPAGAAQKQERYYAHAAVEDQYGVIAPWYTGQNGQFDYRVRIASETLRRYPWVEPPKAPSTAPEYAFNNTWRISPQGAISIPPLNNWNSAGRGQGSARVILALSEYYRYSGDPAALAQLSAVADALLQSAQTSESHPWPRFLISVPVAGKPYGQASEDGWIQLDIAAEAGVALLRAYEVVGNRMWLDAVKHWADVFVAKRNRTPGAAPWGRYANPEKVNWGSRPYGNSQTGGIVYQLTMLDELIRLGYTGHNNDLVEARDAARAYMRDVLLPAWAQNDTWGRNYWDWEDPVQSQTTTDWAARYMLDNKGYFPNWKVDVRNILTIFLNHTSVSPKSRSEVYSGAWAFPESSGCCDTSLAWGPMELALDFARYGVEANDEWAKEIARRAQILATYEVTDTGVVQDNIDGGGIAADGWMNAANPSALKWVLRTIAWLPEILGPSRESHIVRSSATVTSVVYGKGNIHYTTFDAPAAPIDVMRISFVPSSIAAGGAALAKRQDLDANGYTLKELSNGDCIVSIRHDGATAITVEGKDPQEQTDDSALKVAGHWSTTARAAAWHGSVRTAEHAGDSAELTFTGNQVRLVGAVGPDGGKADIYVDGVKQLVGVDYWNARQLDQQILYYRSGLPQGKHALRIVATGTHNPLSGGTKIDVDAVQHSAARGETGYGSGGGPTYTQRMIFGFTERQDYVDTAGHSWRPGTEFVVRSGDMTDSVARSWWTMRQVLFVTGTADPELYKYGVHAPEFVVNVTVGPGKYFVRLKLAEHEYSQPNQRVMDVFVNDELKISRLDVVATGASVVPGARAEHDRHPAATAVDLVFDAVKPKNGMIAIRLVGDTVRGMRTEAMLQALEVGQEPGKGSGGDGATPVTAAP
jgi:hypothetical protein